MRVALVGRYRVPYPFSEHSLDYPMLKVWAERLGELVLIVQGSQGMPPVWHDGNLIVHYAPSKIIGRNPLGFVAWSAYKLIELHRDTPIDVVNGSDLWGSLIGILTRPLIRGKVLVQLQGEFIPPNRFLYTPFSRLLLFGIARFVCRRADMVRCLYQASAERVAALGVPMSKIAIVPSRCDISLFDVERFPPKNSVETGVLYVGNLAPGKGVHFLLKALPEVVQRHPGTTLTIVGTGPQEIELRKFVDNLSIGQHVRFLGRRPHYEIPSLMYKSNVFAFPSLSEATPRAVMEAMAMGLPVVATRVGGIPEMIEHGRTGLLVEPANPEQLAEAICRALHDPVWAREAGQLARQRVLERYTLEKHNERMIALHHKVLSQ